ncbi:hypothetical protein BS50DRAFT_605556 [Corynespora cassiicola Philippines]|uniref:CFEM domain-containing protein n=1 Tax=Corynespora cassiicola Philippines TaxID=1448308 RepID=A0A2T2MZC3_CORCC|nr:hypothetical protein BS50DRAFT_605556 [Corynespora cassiicola Philippines]
MASALFTEDMPPCAIACILNATAQSPCGVQNIDCTCTNSSLQSNVETCVLQTCTIKEGLTAKNITSSLCKAPFRDRSGSLKVMNIAFAIPTNICVPARIIGKFAGLGHSFGMDDICLIIATYVGLTNAIITDRGAIPSGLGRDVWTLNFSSITAFARFFYFIKVLYFVELTFVKLSFLFFYKRIFPRKEIARMIWVTIAFNSLFGLSFTLASILGCRPISRSWTYWDGSEPEKKCINTNSLVWSNAGISVAVDLWMLAIPLSQVIHLQLPTKKKIALAFMFGIGTFVTIVSILRLHSLIDFAKSRNPTWDQWEATMWSIIEINVGIVGACMPMFRAILARAFPRVFGSTASSPKQSYENGVRNNPGKKRGKILVKLNGKADKNAQRAHQARKSISRIESQEDEIELVEAANQRSEESI